MVGSPSSIATKLTCPHTHQEEQASKLSGQYLKQSPASCRRTSTRLRDVDNGGSASQK